jgi:hypothetical protein
VFLTAFVDNPGPAGEFRGRENPAPGYDAAGDQEPMVRHHPAPKSRHGAQYIPPTRDRNTPLEDEFNSPWRSAE